MKANNSTIIKVMMILITAASIITFGKATKSDDVQSNEGTKSFVVNKGGKLVVNVNPGEIKISTWEKNEVLIKVSGLDKDELKKVEMNLNGNTVTLKYNSDWGWGDDAEYKITVPSQFNIDAKTYGGDVELTSDITGDVELISNGGDLTTKNINGKAKLTTQGGDVKTGNVSGSLYLNTMGGDIKVGDIKGGPNTVSTMGGDIRIGKVSADLDAITYGGDINVNGTAGKVSLETMGGNISVVDANGKLMMDTKGGSLLVKNGSGSVKGVTYGGAIELINLSGSVDVKTIAGSISAVLNPSVDSKIQLVSQIGEIELSLSPSVKANVDAEIRAWGNWEYLKDLYKIESDFPSTDGKQSSSKKQERSFTINGGGAKIILKTNNGSIKIKSK